MSGRGNSWLSVALLVVMLSVALGVGAQEYPEMMLILDCSGSMLESAGDMTKIEAAKVAVSAIVPAVPPEVPVGLTAYSHRRKSDCGDIEILIQPGSADRDALLAKVEALEPKGMTPIAGAVTLVADAIKASGKETVIVLVSDGKENCHVNPHGVVRRLKVSGIRFILYVIGFGVTEDEKVQLMSLAKAGGGEYLAATDVDTLLAALESVKQKVELKVEKARTTEVSAKSKLGKLQIVMPENGAKSIAAIKLARAADGKLVKTVEGPKPDSIHPLPSASYEVIMGFANPNYQDPTEVSYGIHTVEGGETTTLTLGSVVLNLADKLGEAVHAVSVVEMGAEKPLVTVANTSSNDYYLFKPKPVPEGLYDLVFEYYRSPQATLVATGIEVGEGGSAVVTLDSGFAIERPADQAVTGWDLVPAGKTEPALVVRRGSDNEEPLWRHFCIPPGKYDLNMLLDGMEEPLLVGEGIEIKKGQTVVFDSGL